MPPLPPLPPSSLSTRMTQFLLFVCKANTTSYQITCLLSSLLRHDNFRIIIIIIINPLTTRVVGAPQMILQPVFSIFPCSPLPYGTCLVTIRHSVSLQITLVSSCRSVSRLSDFCPLSGYNLPYLVTIHYLVTVTFALMSSYN